MRGMGPGSNAAGRGENTTCTATQQLQGVLKTHEKRVLTNPMPEQFHRHSVLNTSSESTRSRNPVHSFPSAKVKKAPTLRWDQGSRCVKAHWCGCGLAPEVKKSDVRETREEEAGRAEAWLSSWRLVGHLPATVG